MCIKMLGLGILILKTNPNTILQATYVNRIYLINYKTDLCPRTAV